MESGREKRLSVGLSRHTVFFGWNERGFVTALERSDDPFKRDQWEDNTLRVFDSISGDQVGADILIPESINSASLSADGRFLVVQTHARVQRLRLWDVRTGRVLRTLYTGKQVSSALSPNDQILAVADGAVIRFFETATGNLLGKPITEEVDLNAVAFSSDGMLIAAARTDGAVRLWSTATQDPVSEAFRAHSYPLAGVSIRGEHMITAAWDDTVRLWSWDVSSACDAIKGLVTQEQLELYSPPAWRWHCSWPDGSS
jgi:WD40 repeat protein